MKSARVVGEVMGRLHPHGDGAIYDALVRMVQPWSLRLPMIDGHGNFGSPDDPPAAMRYTECRMAPAAVAMTASIDEDTVDFKPNYDSRETEPVVLPAAIPNLVVNGASGIAVGMATNIAPHNLVEVVQALRHLVTHPQADLDALMRFIPGPDLPTGGKIVGLDGIRDAYETGRGSFKMRATARVESVTPRRKGIVVTELPYGVGPERVIERIKSLVQGKKLPGHQRRQGPHRPREGPAAGHRGQERLRARRRSSSSSTSSPRWRTPSASTPSPSSRASRAPSASRRCSRSSSGTASTSYAAARRSAATKAADRLHLVEGLLVAILDIDEVIQLIRSSDNAEQAKGRLIDVFDLSEVQATYILDMPLRRLTRFSKLELDKEKAELQATIDELDAILEDDKLLRKVVSDELNDVAKTYGTPAPHGAAGVGRPDRDRGRRRSRWPTTRASSTSPAAACSPAPPTPSTPGDGEGRAKHDVVVSAVRGHRPRPGRRAHHAGPAGQARRARPADAARDRQPPAPAGRRAGQRVPVAGGGRAGARADHPRRGLPRAGARHPPGRRQAGQPRAARRTATPGRSSGSPTATRWSARSSCAPARRSSASSPPTPSCCTSPRRGVRPQGRSGGGIAGVRLAAKQSVVFFGAFTPDDAPVVVTASGSGTALPGTEPGAVKVTPFAEYPAKGRGTGGVRCHRFLKGEDTLVFAWAGPGPARAAAASGAAVDLPDADRSPRRLRRARLAAGGGRVRTGRLAALRDGGVTGCAHEDRPHPDRPARPGRAARPRDRAQRLLGRRRSRPTSPEDTARRGEEEPRRRRAGVRIGLSTPKLPPSVNGLLAADGVATHDPAFKGTIKVAASGITADADVVAVDGIVYAKLPFTSKFVPIDPADYGAPDPADLMNPDGGLSSLLTAAAGRGGGQAGARRQGGAEQLHRRRCPARRSRASSRARTATADLRRDLHRHRPGRAGQGRAHRAVLPKGDDVTYTITFDELRHEAEHHQP